MRTGSYACHVCHSAHFSRSGAPCGARLKKCVGTGKGGSSRYNCCIRLRPKGYLLTNKDCYPPPPLLETLQRTMRSGVSRFHDVIRSPTFGRCFPIVKRGFLGATPGKFPGSCPCLGCLRYGRCAITYYRPSDFFLTPSFLSHASSVFGRVGHFSSFIGCAVSSFRWFACVAGLGRLGCNCERA